MPSSDEHSYNEVMDEPFYDELMNEETQRPSRTNEALFKNRLKALVLTLFGKLW